MTDREFWARAFLSSESWNADGNLFNESRAHHAGEMADAALVEYRKRFGANLDSKITKARNTAVRLAWERDRLKSLERTQSQDSPEIAESKAEIARLEQLIGAD